MEKEISQAVIRRLPRYYRYLDDLLNEGAERISSNELSVRMNVTASQIRQDFNNFGGFGQQGYGYNVRYLHSEIGKILGMDHKYKIIIVGAGNMGQALAKYANFEKQGFFITGLFDVDPDLIGLKIRNTLIYNLNELPNFVEENDVDIAVLTLPKDQAEKTANMLVGLGIHAIWNFAQIDLDLPSDVIVENVHLADSLMLLSYNIAKNSTEKIN